MSELIKLSAALDQLYTHLQSAQSVADAATARQLQDLTAKIQKYHAQFASAHEAEMAKLDQQQAKLEKSIPAMQQQIAKAKQEVAARHEAAKKKPAPPPPPPPPIDPALAKKLRGELLERFGGLEKSTAAENPELWKQLRDWQS